MAFLLLIPAYRGSFALGESIKAFTNSVRQKDICYKINAYICIYLFVLLTVVRTYG